MGTDPANDEKKHLQWTRRDTLIIGISLIALPVFLISLHLLLPGALIAGFGFGIIHRLYLKAKTTNP